MTDFNVGDLVEARKGETRIVARLVWSGDCLFFDGWGSGVLSAVDQGFTLSLVEAATPPLPKEAGIYESRHESIMSGCSPWVLDAEGDWWLTADSVQAELVPTDLVRLEPVPDIARKVIDATIRTFNSKGGNIVDALISVSQEFEVGS